MDKKEILEKLTEIFKEVFSQKDLVLTDETKVNELESWDSLKNMQMVSSLEEEFDIQLKFNELGKLVRVGDIVAIIEKKLD